MMISNWVLLNKFRLIIKDKAYGLPDNCTPADLYGKMKMEYPKFHKMDALCQWTIIAAEYLLSGTATGTDKSRFAIVTQTHHGSYDTDLLFMQEPDMPSPAKFVYTLPNIVAGELAIRHGLKGEQMCIIAEKPDFEQIWFTLQDMFQNRLMAEGICGWINYHEGRPQISLFHIKQGTGLPFTAANMQHIYKNL